MKAPRFSRFVPVLWATPLLLVAVLQPWTIRPIGDREAGAFDAGMFARDVWPRVLQVAAVTATDGPDVATSGPSASAEPRFLEGTGVVAALDRQSRVGLMRVRMPGAASVEVTIQIGPVIRGTALRDASGFIGFSDFTNQSDFAAAANALNDHVLQTVVPGMPLETFVGRTVTFVGATGRVPLRDDGAIEIVPVQLEFADGEGA